MKDTVTQIKSLWGDIAQLKKSQQTLTNTINLQGDDWVSVKDYGAKGDGSTNDTVSIQNALNSGAKLILFPQGTYNITGTLKVSSNTVIFGYGATLFRNASIDSMMMNKSDGSVGLYGANINIKVLGLRFYGNRATYTNSSTLLAFGHSQGIEVRDCEFLEGPEWHCIELNAVKDALVTGCTFHDTNGTSEMLQLDLAQNNVVFPWFGPFDNTPCLNITITNNTFYNGKDGIGSHALVEGFPHTNILIAGNTFHNLTGTAIKPYNYQNLTISNNIIDTAYQGIRYTNYSSPGGYVRNHVITGNRISNISDGGTDGRGIVVEATTDVIISNNSLYNINRHAIGVNFCTRFTIDSNIVNDYDHVASQDCFGAICYASNYGTIMNNIIIKSTVNPTHSASILVINGQGNNIIIDNNTVTFPSGETYFTASNGGLYGGVGQVQVGTNTINGKSTPYASAITANYTYKPTDSFLNVDTSAGNVTITITPRVFNKAGLIIKKTSGDANTVTIVTAAGTINGGASIVLTTQNQAANIKSDWVNLDAIVTG